MVNRRCIQAIVTSLALLMLPAAARATLVIGTMHVPVTQNFDSLGTSGLSLSVLNGATGWRVVGGASPTFASGSSTLTQLGNGSFTAGGSYNFGGTGNGDRAVGFLTSGSFTSPQNLMVQLQNSTGGTIAALEIDFDYEKYRTGTRAFDWTFFGSVDGVNWTSYSAGDHSYVADVNSTTYGTPLSSTSKAITISGLSIANGSSYFLRWTLAGVGGSTNGQGIGIDNFSITAIPEASSFLFAGVVAGVAGLRWGGRRWRLGRAGL